MGGSHNVENVLERIQEIILDWDLGEKNITFVTDNAGEIKRATSTLGKFVDRPNHSNHLGNYDFRSLQITWTCLRILKSCHSLIFLDATSPIIRFFIMGLCPVRCLSWFQNIIYPGFSVLTSRSTTASDRWRSASSAPPYTWRLDGTALFQGEHIFRSVLSNKTIISLFTGQAQHKPATGWSDVRY